MFAFFCADRDDGDEVIPVNAAGPRKIEACTCRGAFRTGNTDLGIDHFILSGYPHLEECYRFAELVFPLLPLKATTGRERKAVRNAGPFGEMFCFDSLTS